MCALQWRSPWTHFEVSAGHQVLPVGCFPLVPFNAIPSHSLLTTNAVLAQLQGWAGVGCCLTALCWRLGCTDVGVASCVEWPETLAPEVMSKMLVTSTWSPKCVTHESQLHAGSSRTLGSGCVGTAFCSPGKLLGSHPCQGVTPVGEAIWDTADPCSQLVDLSWPHRKHKALWAKSCPRLPPDIRATAPRLLFQVLGCGLVCHSWVL